MKKVIGILLILTVLLSMSACSSKKEAAPVCPYQNVGEAVRIGGAEGMISFWDKTLVYIFHDNDKLIRISAEMTPDLSAKASEALFSEDGWSNLADTLSDTPVATYEDLTSAIPDQKKLDKLTGKTGQQLLDDGFEIVGYSIDEETVFFLEKGLFEYNVTFNETITVDEPDEEEQIEILKSLTVKRAEYTGVSSHFDDLSVKD